MKRCNLTQTILLVLLIVFYILAFREIILNLSNGKALLQGDDMGGFLRHIALLSKYWIIKPIPVHQDQLFAPSLSNAVGAFVYKLSSNILLSYLITITLLIVFGSYGLKELLSLYGVTGRIAGIIAIMFYIFNPAIASMIFTGEVHIVTTYFMLPYALLIVLAPIMNYLNIKKYMIYALILLLHIPYIHVAFGLQSLLVLIPYISLNVIIARKQFKFFFKRNISNICSLLIIIFTMFTLVTSLTLRVKYMAVHEPIKLYASYPLSIYKKHSLQNIFEALSLRPITVSFNYYYKDTSLYLASSLTTSILFILVIICTIIMNKYSLKKKIIAVISLSVLLAILFGLGPNSPYPFSMIFEHIFSHYRIFNLLRMSYRYSLIIAFFVSLLTPMIVNAITGASLKNRHKTYQDNISKVTGTLIITLIILNALFVSIQGFNKTISIPDDWVEVSKVLTNKAGSEGILKLMYIPSYPYTTILTSNPSRNDVGSLNYLATFLETRAGVVVFSNDYLYQNLIRLLLTFKEQYPLVALDLFKNLKINGIVITKHLYPITKANIIKHEASYFYEYINKSCKLSNVYLFDKNTILMMFEDNRSVMTTNSLVIAYPLTYQDLALILRYFSRVPIALGYENNIRTLIDKVYDESLNINMYIVLTRPTLIPFILSVAKAKKIYEPLDREPVGWFYSGFLRLYRIYNDELKVELNINKPVLLLFPVLNLYNNSFIEIIVGKHTVYNHSVPKGIQYFVVPLSENTTNIRVNIKTSKWMGIGSMYILTYEDLKHLYSVLEKNILSKRIDIILVKSNYGFSSDIVLLPHSNEENAILVNLIHFLQKIRSLVLHNVRAVLYHICLRGDIDFNQFIREGYIYIPLQSISNVTLNLEVNIHDKGISISLGGLWSIIVAKSPKIEDAIIVTVIARISNSWIPVYVLGLEGTNTAKVNFEINSTVFKLKVSSTNKTYIYKLANQEGRMPKFIMLGVYKGSKIILSNISMIINNDTVFNLNRVGHIHGVVCMYSGSILDNFVTRIHTEKVIYSETREWFRYHYILRPQEQNSYTNVFVLYEYPYTLAWYSSSCIILSGVFHSYLILLPLHDSNVCSVYYNGFNYTDLYYVLIALLLIVFTICRIIRYMKRGI